MVVVPEVIQHEGGSGGSSKCTSRRAALELTFCHIPLLISSLHRVLALGYKNSGENFLKALPLGSAWKLRVQGVLRYVVSRADGRLSQLQHLFRRLGSLSSSTVLLALAVIFPQVCWICFICFMVLLRVSLRLKFSGRWLHDYNLSTAISKPPTCSVTPVAWCGIPRHLQWLRLSSWAVGPEEEDWVIDSNKGMGTKLSLKGLQFLSAVTSAKYHFSLFAVSWHSFVWFRQVRKKINRTPDYEAHYLSKWHWLSEDICFRFSNKRLS